MAIPKGCGLLVLGFLAIALIVYLAFHSKTENNWCNSSLNAGDCVAAESDDNICYCIDEDTDSSNNQLKGIYEHSQSRCEALNGTLAVLDTDLLLKWLAERMYEKGIDNAFIGLMRRDGVWQWMHQTGPASATEMQWRKEFPINHSHDYITLNVETVKKNRTTEIEDDDDGYIYYNFDHYMDSDPAYKWYGLKSTDNLMNDNYFYRGAYYICQYSSAPDASLLQEQVPKTSNNSETNNEQDSDECFCKNKEVVKLSELEGTTTFTSPRYPNNYCSDLNCRWMISVPQHLAIKFETVVFHLENKFDYLHIFDGLSSTDDPLMASCTGSFCSDLLSSKHEMQVHFSSDHVTTDLGFKVRVTAVDPDPCYCSETVSVTLPNLGDSFTLYSPNYPEKYCQNHDCHWTINAPDGYGLQVVWSKSFSIEKDKDFVSIYDGNSHHNKSLGSCTGYLCNDAISTTEEMHIHFLTDDDPSENTGFTGLVSVVQNYCKKIEDLVGSVSYNSNEREDGNIPVSTVATLVCSQNAKVMTTTDRRTSNASCDGTKWVGHFCIPGQESIESICELNEISDLDLVADGHNVQVEFHNVVTGQKEPSETFTCDNSTWYPSVPVCHSSLKGMLIVGGMDEKHGHVPLEMYSPFENSTDEFGFELIENRFDHASAILNNGTMIIVGGSKKKTKLTDIQISSSEFIEQYTKRVSNGPEIIEVRQSPGAAVFNDQLIICGGEGVHAVLHNSCEILRDGHWELMKETMNYWRATPALVVVDRQLFAIDGILYGDGRGTVEKYTMNDGWTLVAPLIEQRFGPAACAFKNAIIACGGQNDNTLSSCERYYVEEDRWELIAHMNEPRKSFTMTVFSGRLYVVAGRQGGFKGRNLDSVERYDEANNTWVMEDRHLKHSRFLHTVISLPNIMP